MVSLNLSEKRIIFRILNLIMKADFVINPAEVEYLDKIFNSFQMELSEFDHMEDVELEELINGFSLFPAETKEYAKKLFMEMAECDGYVDPREIVIINSITG
ncbi:MAG: hypothetical protein J5952_05040 [Prevotella sp.]|nr:hypothetical protein [Prevotella sp.]